MSHAALPTNAAEAGSDQRGDNSKVNGSSVVLNTLIWMEDDTFLGIRVSWKGQSYIGILVDSTKHQWASPGPFSRRRCSRNVRTQTPYRTGEAHVGTRVHNTRRQAERMSALRRSRSDSEIPNTSPESTNNTSEPETSADEAGLDNSECETTIPEQLLTEEEIGIPDRRELTAAQCQPPACTQQTDQMRSPSAVTDDQMAEPQTNNAVMQKGSSSVQQHSDLMVKISQRTCPENNTSMEDDHLGEPETGSLKNESEIEPHDKMSVLKRRGRALVTKVSEQSNEKMFHSSRQGSQTPIVTTPKSKMATSYSSANTTPEHTQTETKAIFHSETPEQFDFVRPSHLPPPLENIPSSQQRSPIGSSKSSRSVRRKYRHAVPTHAVANIEQTFHAMGTGSPESDDRVFHSAGSDFEPSQPGTSIPRNFGSCDSESSITTGDHSFYDSADSSVVSGDPPLSKNPSGEESGACSSLGTPHSVDHSSQDSAVKDPGKVRRKRRRKIKRYYDFNHRRTKANARQPVKQARQKAVENDDVLMKDQRPSKRLETTTRGDCQSATTERGYTTSQTSPVHTLPGSSSASPERAELFCPQSRPMIGKFTVRRGSQDFKIIPKYQNDTSDPNPDISTTEVIRDPERGIHASEHSDEKHFPRKPNYDKAAADGQASSAALNKTAEDVNNAKFSGTGDTEAHSNNSGRGRRLRIQKKGYYYQCLTCLKLFRERESLDEHQLSCHGLPSSGVEDSGRRISDDPVLDPDFGRRTKRRKTSTHSTSSGKPRSNCPAEKAGSGTEAGRPRKQLFGETHHSAFSTEDNIGHVEGKKKEHKSLQYVSGDNPVEEKKRRRRQRVGSDNSVEKKRAKRPPQKPCGEKPVEKKRVIKPQRRASDDNLVERKRRGKPRLHVSGDKKKTATRYRKRQSVDRSLSALPLEEPAPTEGTAESEDQRRYGHSGVARERGTTQPAPGTGINMKLDFTWQPPDTHAETRDSPKQGVSGQNETGAEGRVTAADVMPVSGAETNVDLARLPPEQQQLHPHPSTHPPGPPSGTE